jgi:epoxyqueuosine reductase
MAQNNLKAAIRLWAEEASFSRTAILAPFNPEAYRVWGFRSIPENYRQAASSLLVAALPYGNCDPRVAPIPETGAWIAPFARRNYYREAMKRLQGLARRLREEYGGVKADFRIFCNSPVPEKPLAIASGLGYQGRNGLVITTEAGSLCVLAAMTLPYDLERDYANEQYSPCDDCDPAHPPCVMACPTGALWGDGTLDKARCIQWYASGNGSKVPPSVAAKWGKRLYGCTCCQDACLHNRRRIQGIASTEGVLPAWLDALELLAMSDDEIRAFFKGTALGLSWLGPDAIRRNARLALGQDAGE